MTYRVLARKYRPSSLDDVVGQPILVQTLKQAIINQRIPHAILLHGIRGVGKTTTARIIARCLNCLNIDDNNQNASPCNTCSSCLSLDQDRHLDVIEIDAASRTGVDDIREIIESSKYKAVTGKFKIFIIDEVHMLSKSAFNALLKTLEEPPAHVKFIFATTELRKIPDTILSRCMRFDLKRMNNQDLVEHLTTISGKEQLNVEADAFAIIARAADGSMRDALSLLDQAIALSLTNAQPTITAALIQGMLGLSDNKKIFEILNFALAGSPKEALKTLQEILNAGGDPTLIIQDLLDTVYWITCIKTSPDLAQNSTWPEDMRHEGNNIASQIEISVLIRAWQALLHGYHEIQTSPFPQQALEMVIIRLCYMSNLPSLSQLLGGQGEPQKSSASSFRASTTPISTPSLSATPQPTQTTSHSFASFTASATQTPELQKVLERTDESISIPKTLEELVRFLADKKEILLSSQVIHDIKLVQFEPGKIVLQKTDQSNSGLVSTLRSKLKKLTNIDWEIIESLSDIAAPTIAQQKAEVQKNLTDQVVNHSNVQTFMKHFPEASVSISPTEEL